MRPTHVRRTALAVTLAMSIVACGGATSPGDGAASTTTQGGAGSTTTTFPVDLTAAPEKPSPTAPPTTVTPNLPPGVDPTENNQVRFAIADLATMLAVDESTISVVVWEEAIWPDGAIGCPQPGMSYTQALVDGTRIVLEHEDTLYAYHAAGSRDPFYCANPA